MYSYTSNLNTLKISNAHSPTGDTTATTYVRVLTTYTRVNNLHVNMVGGTSLTDLEASTAEPFFFVDIIFCKAHIPVKLVAKTTHFFFPF